MSRAALSEIVENVFDPATAPATYGGLSDEIGQHGIAVILILFALPSALPIPAAGYSTVLSIPLFLIGLRLLSGHDTLWLPQSIRQRAFDPSGFSRKLVDAMLSLIRFVERFTRPRLNGLTRFRGTRIILGILIITLAASMALPIPGTNTAPAFAVFLIGFALLEEDGFLLIVGVVASFIALAISLGIIFLGYSGLIYLKSLIMGAS